MKFKSLYFVFLVIVSNLIATASLAEDAILASQEIKSTNSPERNACCRSSIEYKRINPTKYRIRFHNLRSNFKFVFNERFDSGWKLYLIPYKKSRYNERLNRPDEMEASNELDVNVFVKDTNRYLNESIISLLNNKNSIETIQFISKPLHGAIQNNNLHNGLVYETWFPVTLENNNSDYVFNEDADENHLRILASILGKNYEGTVVEWPKVFHEKDKLGLNEWFMDLNILKELPQVKEGNIGYYFVDENNSIDFDVVVEYWPQRIVFIGYGVSLVSFVFCLILLVFLRFYTRSNQAFIKE